MHREINNFADFPSFHGVLCTLDAIGTFGEIITRQAWRVFNC